MTADILRTARRALTLAVMLELPLLAALVIFGLPITPYPGIVSLLPGYSHLPGILLMGPLPSTWPPPRGPVWHLPPMELAELALGNVIVFTVVAYLVLRGWSSMRRSPVAPMASTA